MGKRHKNKLTSNFHLTSQISKLMIKQRWGRIINITSVVGHTGNLVKLTIVPQKREL